MSEQAVRIYSFGYWGCGGDVPGLKRRFLTFNNNARGRRLCWVDLRIRRSVRAKGFVGDTPRKIFGDDNYKWIKDFGNLNILEGKPGVKIQNYESGYRQLLEVIKEAQSKKLDLILFCACESVSECHRNNVMQWLRKKIKTDRIEKVEVCGEFPTTLFSNYYDRPEDEAGFNRWRKKNPRGFFLNCEPDWKFKLHSSTCHHFGSTGRTIGEDNWSITRIPKMCGLDRSKLIKWASTLGAQVSECTSCLVKAD